MALEPKDLGGSVTNFPAGVRMLAKDNKGVKLAAIAGAPILEVATPLVESTTPGTYEVWTDAAEQAGRKLAAFVHPVRHQSSATGETLVVAMIAGDVHRDDVPLTAGEAQGDLDAALQDSDLGKRGVRVFGLEDVSL